MVGLLSSSSCVGVLCYNVYVSVVFSCLLLFSCCVGGVVCVVLSCSSVRWLCRLFLVSGVLSRFNCLMIECLVLSSVSCWLRYVVFMCVV